MEELLVGEKSKLRGIALENSGIRQDMNIIIVAIRKKGGKMLFNPSSKALIEIGDTLIALGYAKELARLASILLGKKTGKD